MSKTVDERVVSMQFDNARFERNVQQSRDSLEKLNKSFEKTEAAGYRSGFQLTDAWRKAADVFEYQIANRIIATAKNMTNALLGVTAARAGFDEYELKMGSIQTIMASTGETLETVNGYLNELNEYSDKTIYSFSDMTQNIGKFTNAGVSLDKSVKAIQGVANVAAVSGANANEASRAMYNFSQALSAGYVKLIDWKSIENANMATVEFKEQLIESAVAAGTLIKTGDNLYKTLDGTVINATKNFNDSLQDQWMTSDVLIKTLERYTDETTEVGKKATKAATEVKTFSQLMDTLKESAQSGWAQTWELLIGDFEEAKQLLSGINDVVGGFIERTSESRNELLKQWDALGGRQDLIKGLANVCSFLGDIIKSIGEAFRDIFPPVTAARLAEISKGFRNLTENLKMNDETSEKLAHTFRGLFALVDIVASLFGGVLRTAFKATNAVLSAFDLNILDITAGLANGIIKVRNWIKAHDPIVALFSRIGLALKKGIDGIKNWIDGMKDAENIPKYILEGIVKGLGAGVKSVVNAITNIGTHLVDGIKKLLGIHSPSTVFFEIGQNVIQGLVNGIKNGMSLIGKAFNAVVDFVNEKFGAKGFENIAKLAMSAGLIIFAVKFGKFVSMLASPLDAFAGCAERFGKAARDFSKGFKSLAKGVSMNLKSEALLNAAKAIAIVAAAIIALSLIEPAKLWNAVGVIAVLAAVMAAVLLVLDKINSSKLKTEATEVTKSKAQMLVIGISLVAIAGAILLMATAIKKLGTMSTGDLAKGMIAVALIGVFIKSLARMITGTMQDAKAIKQFRKMFMSFAVALLLLASAVKLIGMLDSNEIGKGLMFIGLFGAFISGLMIASKLSGKKGMDDLAKFTASLGAAMLLMSLTMKIIGGMSWGALGKATVGMAALTAFIVALIAATKLANQSDYLVSKSGSFGSRNVEKAGTKTTIGKTLIAISGAMLLMAATLRIIGGMSWGNLAKATIGMGLLTGFIVALIAATKLANQSKVLTDGAGGKIVEKTTVGRTILAIAGAMMLMAVALRFIGGMQWGALIKGVAGIAVLELFILGLVKALGAPGTDKKLGRIGSTVTQLGIAMIAMSLAMRIIGSMDLNDLIKGTTAIILMGTMLTGLVKAAGNIKAGQMGAIIALTVAIGVLATAIGVLSIINPKKLTTSTAAMAGIMIVFTYFAKTLSTINVNKQTATRRLITLGIMTAIVGVMAGLIFALSTVRPERAIASTVALSVLLLSFATAMRILNEVTKTSTLTKTLGRMAILTAIVAVLGAIVAGLSHITNPAPAIAAAIAISTLLLTMAATLQILNGVKSISSNALTALAALTAIIAGLAIVLMAMGDIKNPTTAIAVAIALSTLLLAMSVALHILSSVQKVSTSALVSLGMLTIIMGLMGAVLYSLKGLEPTQAVGVAIALSVMLLAMSAALAILGSIKTIAATGIVSLALLTVVMGLMGAVLYTLQGLDPDKALGIALSLSTLLLAMSAACLILTVVGLGGPAALYGVAALAAVVVAVGGLVVAIGALTEEFPKLEEFLDKGIPILEKIGYALGSFFGNIVGGLLAGITSGLPEIGTNLSAFMENAKGFIDGAQGIDESLGNGVTSLAKAIIALTAANLLEGITRWLTGGSSLSDFGEEIAEFAPNLKKFADEVSGMDVESVKTAADAVKVLADMTDAIPNESGIFSWFTGQNNIGKFAENLVPLGEGIKGFSSAVTGVNTESIVAAANAAKTIAEMTNIIPNESGVISWFTGPNNISKFAGNLTNLGIGIAGFGAATSGIDTESIIAASNAAKTIAEMTDTIPNESGVVSWFTGPNNISKFAGNLVALGEGISGFGIAVTGLNAETIRTAASAAKSIAEMTEHIPNETGVISWFTGQNNISKFAGNLKPLGEGIKGFGDAVAGLVPNNVTVASKAAESIAAMTAVIPQEKGIKAWFGWGESSVATFAENIPALGAGIKGFGDAVAGIVPANVEAAANAAKSIAELTSYIPEDVDDLTDFGSKLGTFGTQLKEFFTNMSGISEDSMAAANKALDAVKKIDEVNVNYIESVTEAIRDFMKAVSDMSKDIEDDLDDAGKEAIEAFVDAIEESIPDAEDACAKVLDACVDAFDGCSDMFESAGKQVVAGFAGGIDENTYSAEAKARAMAKAAAKAAEEALDINSPSKVFYTIGDFTGLGFVKGLSGYVDASYDVGTDMAKSAKSGLSDAISKVRNLINSDMDLQPTIRPVLDLSNVRAGANMLNNVFGSNRTVGVMSNVGMIASSMGGYGQNGTNTEVVSEIKKLRKELNNVGNTTNIIEGITYDDSSNINDAVKSIVRAARIERRV